MEDRNNLFPVFLKLHELHTLLIGGGNVGLEKLSAILKSSPAARVTVVADRILDEVRDLSLRSESVTIIERKFEQDDLLGKDLVIMATDNPALHRTIREVARARNLLVNVADTPLLCDFYLGSIITKGNVKIGISTNGKSPTIAKRLREHFEEALPDDLEQLLTNMQHIREKIKGDFAEKVRILNEITTNWLQQAESQNEKSTHS